MSLPRERIYTIDDICALPDGERAELIDGRIYYMAPPSRRHQEIAGELFTSIHNYIRAAGGSCKPYIAPFAVFLNENDRNYVEPDISIICDPEKLDDRGCAGAPDWIIEIDLPGLPRQSVTAEYLTLRPPASCVKSRTQPPGFYLSFS